MQQAARGRWRSRTESGRASGHSSIAWCLRCLDKLWYEPGHAARPGRTTGESFQLQFTKSMNWGPPACPTGLDDRVPFKRKHQVQCLGLIGQKAIASLKRRGGPGIWAGPSVSEATIWRPQSVDDPSARARKDVPGDTGRVGARCCARRMAARPCCRTTASACAGLVRCLRCKGGQHEVKGNAQVGGGGGGGQTRQGKTAGRIAFPQIQGVLDATAQLSPNTCASTTAAKGASAPTRVLPPHPRCDAGPERLRPSMRPPSPVDRPARASITIPQHARIVYR